VYANDKPGLGIDLNEELAARYPCKTEHTQWTQTRIPDGSAYTP
jgi:mannonate dehydratase